MKNIKRSADIITTAAFLSIIFVFATLFWILPDGKFSDEENRSLQQFPRVSFDNLISGRLTLDIGKYYADQFPFRNYFVGAKTAASYALGINQNKGAVIAKDDYIIQRFDIYDDVEKNFDLELSFSETMANIKNNCTYINNFYKNLQSLNGGVNFFFAVPPRKIDVMTNKLPAFFPTERNEVYYETLNLNLDEAICHIDLRSLLLEKNSEYIYYKTDHHWTTLGAYYAYAVLHEKIIDDWEVPALEQNLFTIEKVSNNFYGTTWSKSGAKWTSPDDIYYYRIEGDEEYFITKIHGRKTFQGFYDLEYLDKKDKYASFIGGTNAHTSIYLNEEYANNRYKLLLITDSFGQCIVPFFAWYYDIEILDLRFFDGDIYKFIEENGIETVLILQGMESLSTQNNLIKLNTGRAR